VSDSPHYLQPYQEAVENYGGTFDATLWHSKEGQVKRFEVFCSFANFANHSILDVGCGIGDFAQYLIEKQINYSSFHGIDAMAEMINTANTRSFPNARFSVVDIVKTLDDLPRVDWITCSGTLNAMGEPLAIKIIDNLYAHCTLGLAFNFLSDQSRRDPNSESLEPASRFHTVGILEHVLQKTPHVAFTQTYMEGHDATIVMTKNKLDQ
jgi:2-polyprenyl-3-methyl-5-hydroxy-6-metoxy-1,4-benzoquinol methylase|tara:strand:+ start:2258 stop:2884 length:627 start_codon:yes stop_codon:yes gene_type:complete